MKTEQCRKCGKEEITRRESQSPAWCKSCKADYYRIWAAKNKDHINDGVRRRYWEGVDLHRQYHREWARQNADRLKPVRLQRYQDNLERERKRQREYHAKNRARRNLLNRERRRRNRELETAKRRSWQIRHLFRRTALLLRSTTGVWIEPLILWGIWRHQRGRCTLTGRVLDGRGKRSVSLDHIVPRCTGGPTEPVNLRWLCHDANVAKYKLSDEEFFRLCSDVIGYKLGDITEEADVPLGVPDWAMRSSNEI